MGWWKNVDKNFGERRIEQQNQEIGGWEKSSIKTVKDLKGKESTSDHWYQSIQTE